MIKDIYKKYNQERIETKKDINNRERIELLATLEDLKLNKLVKSKKTGKVGVLKVENTSFMANEIKFYPLRKDGNISKVNEYCFYEKVDEEYEPFLEENNE